MGGLAAGETSPRSRGCRSTRTIHARATPRHHAGPDQCCRASARHPRDQYRRCLRRHLHCARSVVESDHARIRMDARAFRHFHRNGIGGSGFVRIAGPLARRRADCAKIGASPRRGGGHSLLCRSSGCQPRRRPASGRGVFGCRAGSSVGIRAGPNHRSAAQSGRSFARTSSRTFPAALLRRERRDPAEARKLAGGTFRRLLGPTPRPRQCCPALCPGGRRGFVVDGKLGGRLRAPVDRFHRGIRRVFRRLDRGTRTGFSRRETHSHRRFDTGNGGRTDGAIATRCGQTHRGRARSAVRLGRVLRRNHAAPAHAAGCCGTGHSSARGRRRRAA